MQGLAEELGAGDAQRFNPAPKLLRFGVCHPEAEHCHTSNHTAYDGSEAGLLGRYSNPEVQIPISQLADRVRGAQVDTVKTRSMRVAAISDIHADLHALDRVLSAVEARSPDEVWCLEA